MPDCTKCNLCDTPGTLESATEVLSVPVCVEKFAGERFTVWRCSSCGSIHSKEDVDLPHYYEHYPFKNHKLDYFTKVGYRNRIAMLKKVGVTKDSSILDYGCGSGIFVDMLLDAGFTNVSGYDPFIPRFNDRSVLDRKFDVVTSYDVIEHVDNPTDYLYDLSKPLAVGGVLVLGTPNADYIRLRNKPYCAVELSQPYHRHIFSERQLFSLGTKFGLEPLSIYRRFYFDSFFPAVNTRFLWEYINRNGGFLDVCVKPLNLGMVFRSPKLMLYALLGYFWPERGNILLTYRKAKEVSLGQNVAAAGNG